MDSRKKILTKMKGLREDAHLCYKPLSSLLRNQYILSKTFVPPREPTFLLRFFESSPRPTCKYLTLLTCVPKVARHSSSSSSPRTLLYLLIFLHIITGALSVHIQGIRMPDLGVFGHSVELECLYEIDANNFYSLRWSLNGEKFYSFVRGNSPEKVDHNSTNVQVELSLSDHRMVTIVNVTPSAEGTYQCEVMEEKPTFEKASFERNLTVVKLPDRITIQGLRRHYRDGESLEVTCTARHSWPAAAIYFTVNGENVINKSGIVERVGLYPEEGPTHFPKGSYTSRSRLSLRLTGGHAPDFLLGCHAKVMTLESIQVATVKVSQPLFSFFNSGVAGWVATRLVASVALAMILLY